LIKKSAVSALFLVSLLACSPDTNQQKLTTPFQCIKSQTVCEINTDFGTFLVTFNVEQVLTELPINIRVELKQDTLLSNKTSEQLTYKMTGYMEGKTMFMGKIPLFFTQSTETGKNSQHQFTAETMLGSCSEDVMTWRLWLTVEKTGFDKKTQNTSFFIDFDSTRY